MILLLLVALKTKKERSGPRVHVRRWWSESLFVGGGSDEDPR